MVIDDFYVVRPVVTPDKADSIPIIEANAVLSIAIAAQGFQPIAWWYSELFQCFNGIKLVKPTGSYSPQ